MNKSTSCSSIFTNVMQIWPYISFSLMKWHSTSICLVWSYWTGSWAMLIVALLSQYRRIGLETGKPNSDKIIFNHNNSRTPCAIALYSTFALERVTIDCFLLLQVTKFPPIKVQYPEVDLLLEMKLVQSTSVYTSTCSPTFLENKKPWPELPLKYLSIQYTASICTMVRVSLNWLVTLTTKAISGLVIDR